MLPVAPVQRPRLPTPVPVPAPTPDEDEFELPESKVEIPKPITRPVQPSRPAPSIGKFFFLILLFFVTNLAVN